jgi:hypothetical protein
MIFMTGILPERTYFTSTEGASVHLSLCWSGRFVHHSMANECFMLISSEHPTNWHNYSGFCYCIIPNHNFWLYYYYLKLFGTKYNGGSRRTTKFQWPATQERASQHVIHTCWVTPRLFSLANLKIRYYKDWTIIIYNYGMSVKNALGSWRITTPGPNQGRDANISHSLVLQHLQIWFPNYSNRVTIIFANAYKYFPSSQTR